MSTWLTSELPAHSQWWLGYSFGSSIVWRALAYLQREADSAAGPQRAVLIAPPVGMMDFSGIELALPVDAIAGDRDDFVDSGKLMALEGVSSHLIPGADHFFSGQHGELAEQLTSILR